MSRFAKRKRTEEEQAQRDKAGKRVTMLLIDGQWLPEFDIAEGETIITPREFRSLLTTLRVEWNRSRRMQQRLATKEARKNGEKNVGSVPTSSNNQASAV